MATTGEHRTKFAMQAVALGEQFGIVLGSEGILAGSKTTPVHFRLELGVPEGPSTGGGKQAGQPIKLVPERGQTFVIGIANQAEKSVELRTWEYLAHLHSQRHKGQPMPFDPVPYKILFKKVEHFFQELKMRVVVVDLPPGAAMPASSSEGSSSRLTIILGVALVAALVILVALVALR